MDTDLYLASLLESRSLKINKTIFPALKLDQSQRELSHAEKLKLSRFINKIRFDKFTVGANFKANLGILAPPTGYYATLDTGTYFQSDLVDRNIFRGIAVSNLTNRTTPLSEHELRAFKMALNLHVRDSMLSNFSWLGIYERTSCDSEYQYCLVVVCGLSSDEYEDFLDQCARGYTNSRTVHDALSELFPRFRELARARRRFLLGIMSRLLGTQTPGHEEPPTGLEPTNICPTQVSESVYQELKSLYHGVIFRWSKIPSRLPSFLSGALPSRHLGADIGSIAFHRKDPDLLHSSDHVTVTMDVVLDDFLEQSETQAIRVSGHCVSHTEEVQVILHGPGEAINLYTSDVLLGAVYANQAASEGKMLKTSDIVFVEDPEVTEPRIVCANYTMQRPKPTEQLRPKCVRSSLTDDTGVIGLASTPETLMLFCLEDYEYIT